MPSAAPYPFPGLNPWFESRWPDVHATMIVLMRGQLRRQLPSGLHASVEIGTRILQNSREEKPIVPDATVWKLREDAPALSAPPNAAEPAIAETQAPQTRRLAIRDAQGDLITVLELLSPSNKHGAGAVAHQSKRLGLIESGINLVELDLIRQLGLAILQFEEDGVADVLRSKSDFLPAHAVTVIRASAPHLRELYAIHYRVTLPSIKVPLRPEDPDIWLNLQTLAEQAHEEAQMDQITDYTRDPEPPLSPEDTAWLHTHLKAHELR